MEKVLWVAGVVLYVVGYIATFRFIYRREVDNIFRDVNQCTVCGDQLNSYKMCSEHTRQTRYLLNEYLPAALGIITIVWPMVLVALVIYSLFIVSRWIVDHVLLNVRSKEKCAWEYKIREATIIRMTHELQGQMKALGIDDTSSRLRDSVKILERGIPIPPAYLHGVKNNDTVGFHQYVEECTCFPSWPK